jgi:hypothetical protein
VVCGVVVLRAKVFCVFLAMLQLLQVRDVDSLLDETEWWACLGGLESRGVFVGCLLHVALFVLANYLCADGITGLAATAVV